MHRLTLFTGFIIVIMLSSCTTQNIFSTRLKDSKVEIIDSLIRYNPNYEYTIRVDDKISISVWGEDRYSVGSTYGIYNSNEVYGKWLMVDVNGKIEIPKLGSYEVYGLTVPELKDRLKEEFSEWLINPIVDVKILNKEISLLGEFRDPAVLKIDKDKNYLLEMVARVGGFEFYANLKQIKVLRQVGMDTQVINIDLTENGNYRYKNIPLYPGDIVIAPSKSHKSFDKRISTIIPLTSALTASAIFLKAF